MDPQAAGGGGPGEPSAPEAPGAEVSSRGGKRWGSRAAGGAAHAEPVTAARGGTRGAAQEAASAGGEGPEDRTPGSIARVMEGGAGGPELEPAAGGQSQAGFAAADLSGQERETEMAMDRLASGAQSIPSDIPTQGEDPHSEEEGFAVEEEEETDGDWHAWRLPGGTALPVEQAAGLLHEDWDMELKTDQGYPYDADDIQGSISQEIKPWVCCAPQGDVMYDPSWHHPPPLIPHYSKMVFETGQFDDAED